MTTKDYRNRDGRNNNRNNGNNGRGGRGARGGRRDSRQAGGRKNDQKRRNTDRFDGDNGQQQGGDDVVSSGNNEENHGGGGVGDERKDAAAGSQKERMKETDISALKARQFDVVFLDPPTWSTSIHGAVDLVRDYQVRAVGVFRLFLSLVAIGPPFFFHACSA